MGIITNYKCVSSTYNSLGAIHKGHPLIEGEEGFIKLRTNSDEGGGRGEGYGPLRTSAPIFVCLFVCCFFGLF